MSSAKEEFLAWSKENKSRVNLLTSRFEYQTSTQVGFIEFITSLKMALVYAACEMKHVPKFSLVSFFSGAAKKAEGERQFTTLRKKTTQKQHQIRWEVAMKTD